MTPQPGVAVVHHPGVLPDDLLALEPEGYLPGREHEMRQKDEKNERTAHLGHAGRLEELGDTVHEPGG